MKKLSLTRDVAVRKASKYSVAHSPMVEFTGNLDQVFSKQMELVYKHFEQENKCKIKPSYDEPKYAEFEDDANYTWFLLRWS
jgi:hypothetical protein